MDLDPKTEIQPLIGSKEGILHISLAFLNPGDGVLVPNPGYPTYSSVSKLVEANLIPYKLKEELGWQPDFEELEKMDLSNVKLMWTNYPICRQELMPAWNCTKNWSLSERSTESSFATTTRIVSF